MSRLVTDEIVGRQDNNHLVTIPNGTTLYAPGQVIQTAWKKMDFHAAYSANNDNVSRDISGLNLTLTLKKPNSQVFIQWWIFYETFYNVTFQAKRDGAVIGFNNDVGNVRWSGIGVGENEHSFDEASTPSYLNMCYLDTPGSVGPFTYSLGVRSSDATNRTLWVNRSTLTVGDFYEGGVSWCMIQEIAR